MKPVFVTSNPDKLDEAEKILGFELERKDVEIQEIQAVEIEDVVEDKARKAYEEVGKPVIVTDTGVYIEDLNGFPGALIKWMYSKIGNEGISEIAGGSEANAATVIGYFNGEEFKSFYGEVKGSIAEEPRGEKGFGWDPVFIPDGSEKTFAKMEREEKNSCSMRRKALREMEEEL